MNGLALCSGIGGLELAVRSVVPGYRVVGHVEREAYAAAVLVARMESAELDPAPVWDDLESFPGAVWRGKVDLITAGFPCQPWSVAGSRRGVDDERWIWPDIARVVRDVGPAIVFLENVPGLVTGDGIAAVLGDLARLGFNAEWAMLRASAVGAPHRRERCFILAWRVSAAVRDALRIIAERGSGSTRAPQCGDAEPRQLGLAVDQPDGQRLEGRDEREATRPGAARSGGAVADADSRGCEVERQPEHGGQLGAPGPEPDRHDLDGGLGWPPGPGDAEGWRRWLAAGGPQPAVRRGAHGVSHRLERLHCLGNSVVPQQAARALVELARRAL